MKNETDYNISFAEACEILKKSGRTVSRYVSAGKLNPQIKKSQKGIKYYFNLAEIENFKKLDTTGQMTRQNQNLNKNNDTLSLLNDTINLLQKQLKAKDKQIANFQDRQREANILMGQLQNKVLLLEDKSKGKRSDKNNRTDDTTSGSKWQGWFRKLFKGEL